MSTALPHRPLTGIFWMLVTGFCFLMVTALVKTMGPRLPPAEAAFLRYGMGLIFLIPAARALRSAATCLGHLSCRTATGAARAFGGLSRSTGCARCSTASELRFKRQHTLGGAAHALNFLGALRAGLADLALASLALSLRLLLLLPRQLLAHDLLVIAHVLHQPLYAFGK